MAEGRDGGVDEAGKACRRIGWGQPYGLRVIRVKILDERVGTGEEYVKALPLARARQIEGHPQLVGVEQAEESALLRVRDVSRKRSVTARGIAARRLDLDDRGAEIGQ